MKNTLLLIVSLFIFSCSDDEKPIEVVLEEVERGAVIRTVTINNSEFDINNTQSTFDIEIEEQDNEDGGLLEEVEVFVRFKDNTMEDGDLSTSNVLIQTIPAAEWTTGPDGLPRNSLNYSFEELLLTTERTIETINVKDQFIVSLNLKLTDGRSFDASNASSIIIAFNTFFSSPFCYTINVVDPISPDLFTGIYRMESILEGPNGETFVDELGQVPETMLIEIINGHSPNTREFRAFHNLHHRGLELPRRWEFSIVGNEAVMGKNQLSSPEGYCRRDAAPLLLGPDIQNGGASPTDDTVFELWFVEGFLGFDGECGFVTAPSRYRFSKQ